MRKKIVHMLCSAIYSISVKTKCLNKEYCTILLHYITLFYKRGVNWKVWICQYETNIRELIYKLAWSILDSHFISKEFLPMISIYFNRKNLNCLKISESNQQLNSHDTEKSKIMLFYKNFLSSWKLQLYFSLLLKEICSSCLSLLLPSAFTIPVLHFHTFLHDCEN